jgi:hypothetical protein
MRVIEVIGCISKGIDLEFGEEILGQFLEEPVDDHPSFDTPLAVEDKDDFGELGFVKSCFDSFIAISDVLSGVIEVSLN